MRLSPEAATRRAEGLQALLARTMEKHGFQDASVVIRDVVTGDMGTWKASSIRPSASIAKLYVMVEMERQRAEKGLDPAMRVRILPENMTETWLPVLKVGDEVTVQRLVDLMITRSDNVATNTLMDVLGRQEINATMARLGWPDLQLNRKLGGAAPIPDPGYVGGRNQVRADQVSDLLGRIEEGRLISPEASARMKEILGRQMDNDKIPAALPPDARVFHKTGETSRVTHDTGIVTLGGRRLVLSILSERPPGGNTYRTFANVARDLVLEARKEPVSPLP
ncbi:MAG: serine hydrolase [Candidatus Sericytochromatia bacterium]|nr:serine hydrolase [Candidatus Sericytochromatia bacterium]